MDYKLISALVGAGYDNATIDKIMSALPQVPQTPQVPQVTQVPQVQQVPQVPQVPQADVNADLSRRMLTLMRDMQTAAGFSGSLNGVSNPPKTAEDVSLDILNAGGEASGN